VIKCSCLKKIATFRSKIIRNIIRNILTRPVTSEDSSPPLFREGEVMLRQRIVYRDQVKWVSPKSVEQKRKERKNGKTKKE